MRGVLKGGNRNLSILNDKRVLLLTFSISLIGRIFVILFLGQEQYLYESGSIAQNIVLGNGFAHNMFPPATSLQETCVISPIYPYFLAGAYFIFGINSTAILFVQIIQSLFGALTVYPLYYLARDYYSNNVAILSIFFFALYPDFLHWSYLIQPLTLTIFIAVSIVFLFHNFNKNPGTRNSIALGFGSSVGILVNAVVVSIIGIIFVWMICSVVKQKLTNELSQPKDIIRKVKGFILAIAICGLIITPWEIRCLNVYDSNFVFIKASGFNLWRGNNPNFTDSGIPPWVTPDLLESLNLTKEGDIDSALGDRASTYMITHIPETVMNSATKFWQFWWFPKAFPEESPILRQIIYAPMLLLAIIALFIDRRKISDILILLLPLIAFSALYSVIFVLAHHRIPIQPILFIFSARGFEIIVNRLFKK